mmetsp:Transcript_26202/g.37509  ORF Transcript_26202/g.37509 Transcript_26202/m.37509 type:complete len:331 (-) Transcript_26202:445-1437(-)
MNKLEEARRQLGPFNFENLPLDRNDGIWAELRSPPYSLDLEELSALKNARCTPAQPDSAPKQLGKIPENLIERTWASVVNVIIPGELCTTGIIWDIIDDSILILTCYHSWKDLGILEKGKKKHSLSDPPIVHIKNNEMNTLFTEAVLRDMFECISYEKDYAVIRFYNPQMASILQRIPISYTIAVTMPIHAFGFPGYKDGQAMVIDGEITVIKQNQFQLSLLSAPGLSGSAIIADNSGRAVGYLGGAQDASISNNSQHQSYAYKFDEVAARTHRDESPDTTPEKSAKKPRSPPRSKSRCTSSTGNADATSECLHQSKHHTRSKSSKGHRG